MNTALIVAGGVGSRTGQEIPKQFLTVNEIPIFIYTLKVFQEYSDIDNIIVVTLSDWKEVVRAYCKQFGIAKLQAVIDAGDVRFESIYNGVKYLAGYAAPDDLITLHDANRPLVSAEIIRDSQRIAAEYGNALAVISCNDSMFISYDRSTAAACGDRNSLCAGQTPETFKYSLLKEICDKAAAERAGDLSISALLLKFGRKVYLSGGDWSNFKITTPSDIDMFKALLNIPRTRKIK